MKKIAGLLIAALLMSIVFSCRKRMQPNRIPICLLKLTLQVLMRQSTVMVHGCVQVFTSVDGKEFYVIVALGKVGGFQGVTLKDLGTMLRSSGIFRKELDIIKFDGGLSTALDVRNHPEFGWYPDTVLPLLICVK